MKTIGFSGGSSLCELGTVSDVVLFFDCINYFLVKKLPELNWNLLTDRLFRRYLRLNELQDTLILMEQVKQQFSNLPSSAIDWKMELIGDKSRTWLDPTQENLAGVFSKFFNHFAHCVESAQLFYDTWSEYQPVRTVRTETAWFMVEKLRPLEEYDALEGSPFWMR